MARRHSGLPRPSAHQIAKTELLRQLKVVDADATARQRILAMENEFRHRIASHVVSLPLQSARFMRFHTNPFVLMFQCFKKGYTHIREIEDDILPAKVFSSMETSAGRMVEAVVLPVYAWSIVESGMHSSYSVIDGKHQTDDEFRLATLKSGPRCLNDDMTKDIAVDIITNCDTWANDAGTTQIDFTYGVLYGTKKQSNKKDWHILRIIAERLPADALTIHPRDRWFCEFEQDGITVRVTVRIGVDLWSYIAGHDQAFLEMCVAIIRACVSPSDTEPGDYSFTIADLSSIISLDSVPNDFNVSILQRSQLEWLFFFARHFCDELIDGPPLL